MSRRELNSSKKHNEADVIAALEDIESLGLSIRAAAKKYGFPESTLRHKKTGRRGIGTKRGPNTLLTDAEEEVLVNFIIQSVKRAHPVTKSNVLSAVTSILSEEKQFGIQRKLPPSFGEKPKQKWWKLFRKRHPNLTYRTPETLSSARKNISKAIIMQWFQDAHNYLAEIDALDALKDPSRNFNIDESGFSLSPKQGRVLAERGEKVVFEEASMFQKTNLTVVGLVCADGRVPPCMIIYPRKRINQSMAEQFPDNYDFIVGKTEKGYITYETLYEFICNAFNDWLTKHQVTKPVILWTDWHESRNNFHLAKTLNDLGIILYGLPPNTTHFMQPLDVAVFSPLKKGWSKYSKEWETLNNEYISQTNFAKVFLPAYKNYVTSANIKAGFRKCGLVPYNPEAPDYSKLVSAATLKEHPSTIFEGVEQGGYKEISCQTQPPYTVSRACQTNPMTCVTTRYENEFIYNVKGSLCDMVLEYKPYDPLLQQYLGTPFTCTPTKKEFQSQNFRYSDNASTGIDSFPSTSRPPSRAGTSPSTLSPAVLHHNFYPERQPGKGNKNIRNVVYRNYAISSLKMIEELKKIKDEKEAKEHAKKKRKSSGKKSTGKKAPKRQVEDTEEESLEEKE